MHADRFGQPMTTASARAAALYDDAVDCLFALQPGSDTHIDEALALDPDFALAHCVKARSLLMAGDAVEGRRFAIRGRDLAVPLPRRERSHADIVCRVVHGESAAALPMVREHAAAYPRDAVPLSFALGVYGLLGFGGYRDFHAQQVELLESVAPAWGEDWWFLASWGWAYVEAGRAEVGIPMLDRALELKPDNANAVHGRVHGCYEQGAVAEGEAFIDAWLPSYSRDGVLHGHLAWHQALFALQRGDAERARCIYRDAVRPAASAALPMFTLIDCASLLLRGILYGHPLGDEEQRELAAFVEARFPKPGIPFVNVHLAMAHACVDDRDALADLERGVGALIEEDRQASGPVVAEVCAAIAAYAAGRYHLAARLLAVAMPDFERLGGSHAQRDVLIDLSICAHRYAGAVESAQSVAQERWQCRAQHLNQQWLAHLGIVPQPKAVASSP